jgi:hypothetical protein
MKIFRQENNQYICEECGKLNRNLSVLARHIYFKHNNETKKYYDKWRLENNENSCHICHNENLFVNLSYGYRNGCCKEHMNILGYEKRKKSLLKSHGVENPFQRDDIKNKIKETWIKNYGVDNPNKSKNIRNKIDKTCQKRYGEKSTLSKNSSVRKKWEQKLFEEEGITNVFQRQKVKDKIMQTMLKRYGVENCNQDANIFNRGCKTRLSVHHYKNTSLLYQASYELDFLDNYYDKIDIQNANSIKYVFNNKNKVYHPDFYIPSLNLIVEIKSAWTTKLDEEIKEKKNYTIKQGYNYILIINKNYTEFDKWLQK